MPSPMSLQLSVFKYLVAQKLKGVERYPLVMMLEPLFACNLECAGCQSNWRGSHRASTCLNP